MAAAFTFTKMVVADLDPAIPFYHDGIGLKLLRRHIADSCDYAQEQAAWPGQDSGRDRGAGRC